MEIIKGKIQSSLRIVIYGSEGIGKSTLASKLPEPIFIDTEDGTKHLDVDRVRPKDWQDYLSILKDIPSSYKTVVIDTADWLEALCTEYICAKYKQPGIEAFGYGKGYTYLAESWQSMLNILSARAKTEKQNIVFTAHAKMRKFEQPDEAGAYDRWEMKLSKQVAPLLKEWCDMLLFLNYKTVVLESKEGFGTTKKAQGGKRVVYTTHHACWDAKNRQGLPDTFLLDEAPKYLNPLFTAPNVAEPRTDPEEDAPKNRLLALISGAGITKETFEEKITKRFGRAITIEDFSPSQIEWSIKNFEMLIK